MRKDHVAAGFGVFVLAATVGCSRPEGVTRDPDESARRSEKSEPTFRALPQLPSEFADLGKPCKDPREMRAGIGACDDNNRIVKVRVVTGQRTWPSDLMTIKLANPPDGQPGLGGAPLRDVWVGFEPTRVWLSGDCVMCRLQGFETLVVDVTKANEQALEDLQRLAGLPLQPVLRTTQDFYRALAPRKAS